MTVSLVRGTRWSTLVDHLAGAVSEAATDPFLTLRVVVSSRATGRIVGQQVAARLGISAGIDYLSPADLMRQLADRAGVGRDRSRWRGTPLDLAVADALARSDHPLVRRALAADEARPGRRRATALRVARLLRSYLDQCPELMASWLDGSDDGVDGALLPAELAWQPAVFRAVSAELELDPLALLDEVCAAARQSTHPTFVLAVDHLTQPQLHVMRALAEGPGLTILQPTDAPGNAWAEPLADAVEELPGSPADAPRVAVHDSHGEARQVEVLRDELTRAFAEDPTLEPRDVIVVCPRPERYAHLLDASFAPADEAAHPGRGLRLQPLGAFATNPVLELLVTLLRMGSSRATASEVTDLLLSPPIAHRWRLTDRRAVVELVSGAGIRWGLDAGHRASFELADVDQNTWARGLDRLLIGLAVAPGRDVGLGLSGSDAVTASDMAVVGSLSEVLTRLRRVVAVTDGPATVGEWVERSRAILDDLVGLPYADQWQELHALAVLARFEADHRGHPTELTPHEFAHLVEEAIAPPRARVAAGNGSMQVVPLGELQHVEFRVVAMLGVTDDVVPGRGGRMPDSIDLGPHAIDLPGRRLHQLLTHARAAEQLIIVRQASSQRTNDPTALPVAIGWLLDQLGADPEPQLHPPTATSLANFGAVPSFDAPAFSGIRARLAAAGNAESLTARRRHEARSRAVGPAPAQVTLTQLERFLTNPAKTFLRAAGGIAIHPEPKVIDEMPLEVYGLDNWRLVNALTDAWKEGLTRESVESYFRQREDLPPRAIGDAAFRSAVEQSTDLWHSAGAEWAGEEATHRVDVTLDLGPAGEVRLVDEVLTRSGLALAAHPSQRRTGMFRPWLESLALAAQGIPVPAKLHHFIRTASSNWAPTATQWRVDPLPRDAALAHLTTIVSAHAQAQYRLLPVPAGPALSYAEDHATGRFDAADWVGQIGSYRGRWSDAGREWRLFYAEDVRELFDDEPLPGDPANGQQTAFQAWAWELYGPLTGGMQ